MSNLEQLILDMKESLEREMAGIGLRLDAISAHLDRMDTRLNALTFEVSGISKSKDAADKLDRDFLANLAAQKRAIDELTARVAKLEQAQGQ